MSDVGARVLARLAEVERDARRADGTDYVPTGMLDAPDVLRWVAAMRQVVGLHHRGQPFHHPGGSAETCAACGWIGHPCPTLTALASIWPDDEPAEAPESHRNGPRSAEPGSEVPQ